MILTKISFKHLKYNMVHILETNSSAAFFPSINNNLWNLQLKILLNKQINTLHIAVLFGKESFGSGLHL